MPIRPQAEVSVGLIGLARVLLLPPRSLGCGRSWERRPQRGLHCCLFHLLLAQGGLAFLSSPSLVWRLFFASSAAPPGFSTERAAPRPKALRRQNQNNNNNNKNQRIPNGSICVHIYEGRPDPLRLTLQRGLVRLWGDPNLLFV